MMVIKKTFHVEKQHKNRKMTCHAESRETADLHSDGAGGVEGLVSFLAVEEHRHLKVSNKSHLLLYGIWFERDTIYSWGGDRLF